MNKSTTPSFDFVPPHQPFKAWLAGAVVLMLVGAGGCGGADKAAKRKSPPMPVKTAIAQKGDFQVYLNAIGNVKSLASVNVRTQIAGTLQKIHFTEGQDVKAGDLLAEIDPRPLEAQLAQAQGQLAQAQGQWAQAKGQLEQTKGQLARDQALLANAKLDLARYKEAAEAVTQQQIDNANSAVAQAMGVVAADVGTVAASEGTVAADEGTVIADKAAVDGVKVQLAYCRITAPFDGQVGIRAVDEGNLVSPGDAAGIVTISRMKPVSAFFFVAENDLFTLQKAVATDPKLQAQAYDSDRQHLLATGTLAALDNQMDPATGTVKLRANFDNADLALFPNHSVSVRLLVGTHQGVTLVPAEAVQIADQKRFLYVVKPDNTVERRDVKVAATDEKQAEIAEGVAPGEVVVIDGLDRLTSGSSVIVGEKKAKENDGGKTEGASEGKHPGDAQDGKKDAQ